MTSRTTTIILTALVLSTSAVQAQFDDAVGTADANASIVSAIGITDTADLNFGDVVASAASGTVVMTSAGVRSATAGATLGSSTGISAAAFTVTGDADSTFSITLPSSISIAAGANSMTVDNFTSSLGAIGTLGSGTATLGVGATLQVGATQATGSYTGTFNVTVAYN